ncbi:integumentary mucin C.1-like isoform X4 [Schistocerca cancellata]|uniref:integumentary mucin C.1-like isoform X4 n=1 Tax=Schistocerca cancellata TaxID=274614 RepID=UPI002118332D|nr:integumentary mucin C.1-like isoform X4 [Schistocerca cancellata]
MKAIAAHTSGFVLAVAYLLTGVILVYGSPVGECPPVDPLDHTDHLPDDKNCSLFYKCDHAAPVLFVCPDELHFNRVLEVCDWPDVAGCTANTGASSTAVPTAAPTAGSTSPSTSTDKPQTAAPITSTTSSPAQACPAVGTCPQYEDENSIAKHLPHATNCSQFCKCDHGKPVTMDCPAGLHFNAVLEVCDWPQNAGCSGGSGSTSNPTSSTPSSSSAATTQAPTSAPTAKPTTAAPGTTAEPTTAAPSTTAKPTTAAPTTTAQPTTAAPSSSSTAAPSSPATSAPSGDCPAIGVCPQYEDENSIAKHLPHASNCSQFCKCDHGKPVTMDCPAGLHFNAVLEVCDWPQNAGCSGGSGSTSNPTSSTPSSSSAATTQAPTSAPTAKPTTAAPGTTAEPTTAAPSTTAKPTTAAPTTTAQPTTAAPSSSSTAAPSSPATSAPSGDCPAIGVCPQYEDENSIAKHLPHASNCSQFCKCDHGKPVTMDCPAGLHFNAVLEVCDWPQNAGCSGGSGSTSNPTSSTPSSSSAATTQAPTSAPTAKPTTAAPGTTAEPTTAAPSTTAKPTTAAPTTTAQPTTAAPSSSSTAAPSSPATSAPSGDCPAIGVCPQYEDENSIAKHLPHASNCSQFCKCDHGKPVTMDCPAGLHFNAVLEVCDWPQNAGCSGGSGSTSNPTSSTPPSSSAATTQAPTSAPTAKPTTAAPGTTAEPTTAAPSTTAKPTTAAPTTTAQPTTAAPSSSSTAAPSSPATSAPSGDCPAIGVCPQYEDENSIAKHLPHASNCSQFCKCDHGKPVTMDCPAGLHFNAVLEVCDWPQNAGCSGGSGTTSNPTSSTPSSSSPVTTQAPTSAPSSTAKPTTAAPSTTAKPPTVAPTTTVQPTTVASSTTAKPTTAAPSSTASPDVEPCDAVGSCPVYDQDSIVKHLPHRTNCGLYCRCNHGVPITEKCPDGLHFNAKLEVCDWPSDAGCQ